MQNTNDIQDLMDDIDYFSDINIVRDIDTYLLGTGKMHYLKSKRLYNSKKKYKCVIDRCKGTRKELGLCKKHLLMYVPDFRCIHYNCKYIKERRRNQLLCRHHLKQLANEKYENKLMCMHDKWLIGNWKINV